MGTLRLLLITVITCCFAPWVGAADLDLGDPAPAFALVGPDGRTPPLADYRGQFVVLAWFPKAFTGG